MTDLLKIGSRFRIEGEPFACEDHGTGHIHNTYLLESGNAGEPSRYLLQKLNTRVFKKPEAVQDNIRRILGFLKEHPAGDQGFRDPELIETVDDRTMYLDNRGNFWRCFRYIENTTTFEKVATPEQAFEGGRSFGIFAHRLKDYNPRRLHITIPHFMDAEWRYGQLTYAEFTNPGERLKSVRTELKKIRNLHTLVKRYSRIRMALPDRVAHNDTKISNVLFDQDSGKGISVIDLDTVMTGTLLTDFGDMVRSFTASGKEDQSGPESSECRDDLFRGLADGFAGSVAPFITEVEKSNLLLGARVVIYMQAMRFLTDYLNGDIYYKTSYPDQNLKRTRNQLGLLESVMKKEGLLTKILDSAF
jgi:hypothetical protein